MDQLFAQDHPAGNPRFSPASTAGLTKTILFTFSLFKASTAEATAR